MNLERDLRSRLSPDSEIRFSVGSRALYATDASNYRQPPIGVVIPNDVDDLVRAIATCRRHGVPILNRGGGTSLAGQGCNEAVVLDSSKRLNRILEINRESRTARVEPGVILDELQEAAAPDGLMFGPDPSTHSRCTLGGMIGNNSCGVHSVLAGRTSDNVESLEILTYRGERLRVGRADGHESLAGNERIRTELLALRDRYAGLIRARFPKIPRLVSGYALDQLLPENGFNVARSLVGSEGTCVTILEATLRLIPRPKFRSLAVLPYHDVFDAADHVPEVLRFKPAGLEGMDDQLVFAMKKKNLHSSDVALLPDGGAWLIAEFHGETAAEAREKARAMARSSERYRSTPLILDDLSEQKRIWRVRESGLGATAIVPGEGFYWEGWEDAAVAPEMLGTYLREFRKLLKQYGYRSALYGHFGDGCVHNRISFDLQTRAGVSKFRSFIHDAADLVVRCGGSLSGEHGDGQARAELLEKMYGPELIQAFREFKAIWDPDGKMNPGKLVDPYRLDENLRLGPDHKTPELDTHFAYPEDNRSFAKAAQRCVGVGECRRKEGGLMCPSYMATLEEKHSTRGRARLLFEMTQGELIDDGWRNEEVKEALDLCLACKGCKTQCPVGVDMATYKAEFLSHHYKGRLRPLVAYAMGWIHLWSRWISALPGAAVLVNLVGGSPLLSPPLKKLVGISIRRRLPRFDSKSFRRTYRAKPIDPSRPRVVLWVDTFNDHFHASTARAAFEVLESFGYSVSVPAQTSLCCGRPLYDFGMLSQAKRLLARALDALEEEIRLGTPIIGLEPSCVAVFRDELRNLFPDDPRAIKLSSQVLLLSEFLSRENTPLPRLDGQRALLQTHCHHRAVLSGASDEAILKKMGIEVSVPESGCCGMAGSFGFHAEHEGVSVKIGERSLLPSIRAAKSDDLIVACGFSCREQIAQGTDRRALHLAEVLRQAQAQAQTKDPAS